MNKHLVLLALVVLTYLGFACTFINREVHPFRLGVVIGILGSYVLISHMFREYK